MNIQIRLKNIIIIIQLLIVMGCPASRQSIPQINDHEFVVLIRRISLEFQQESSRLTQTINQLKLALKSELNKPIEARSRGPEYAILTQLTVKSHLKAIYDFLVLQCKAIIDRERFVPVLFTQQIGNKQETEDKRSIKKPVEVILYSLTIINDGRNSLKNSDLLKFERTVKIQFKQVQEPQIVEYDLLNFYKKNANPTPEMVRQAAFEFCQSQSLGISKFQQVGNNFKY